ncbi:MAG TPA: DUF3344 domain-containing protein, partial [Methanosarcinales archaeon]|nr:DUF3344 domain-containing protein [Methanosarcinales archaeon]
MTKFKYLVFCILLLASVQYAGAEYNFDGTPIASVMHGTVAGGMYVAGGHGLENSPYTQSFDVPGTVIYARLYVGVWGGNPDYTGSVETTINGETLGTIDLKGKADTNPNVMCTGFGVYLITYNVSSHALAGANTVSVTTAGDIDGRVYGITLAAIYESENDDAPEVEYWLNDGHENLNQKTPHDSCTTSFSAAASTNPNASLTVGYLCGDPGEKDHLYMNDNQIGGNDVADSMGDSAYGFDLKTFDVTSHFDASGNTLLFERGDETSVHPFLAVLVLGGETAGPPQQEDGKPDLVIAEIETPSRVFADEDNIIEVIVRNQADYDARDAFHVELSDGIISLGSIRVPDLGARENETLTFIWNPDEITDYTLSAKVDVNDVIDEADETNNEGVLVVDVEGEMGYYGDDSIETFEHGTINGSIVYTIGNSSYSEPPLSPDDEYVVECNLTLPDDAIARNARLYIYWTWGKKGVEGSAAEMEVTFNDRKLSVDRQYTDRKGYGSNNYPSGTYCYNVTNHIEEGNGSRINYTTVVKNIGKDYAKFAVCGVNLVVLYEDLAEP